MARWDVGHAFDILCLSACLGDWGPWETIRERVCARVCVRARVCLLVCVVYGKLCCCWISPFISPLITAPIGRAPWGRLSNAKCIPPLLACTEAQRNTHRQTKIHFNPSIWVSIKMEKEQWQSLKTLYLLLGPPT
ncbi:unnamed protein product [Boreogadus saida]